MERVMAQSFMGGKRIDELNQLRRHVARLRGEHPYTPLSYLVKWAKDTEVDDLEEKLVSIMYTDRAVTLDPQDGFELTVKVKDDYDADFSYLGKFVENPESGSVKVMGRYRGEGELNFLSEYGYNQLYADARKYHGMAKSPAHDYAREQVTREAELMTRISAVGITVTALREDVELGKASLWGIDYDPDARGALSYTSYFAEVTRELIGNVIYEAKEKLAKLQEEETKLNARYAAADAVVKDRTHKDLLVDLAEVLEDKESYIECVSHPDDEGSGTTYEQWDMAMADFNEDIVRAAEAVVGGMES